MTLDEFLLRLDSVRSRGNGRYSSRCPSHPDKSPSLSISEGERGILVKCWTGCSVSEICGALELTIADLFFDGGRPDPHTQREAQARRARKARTLDAAGVTIDTLLQADTFVHSRRGLDISLWSDQKLDDELSALAAAYALIEAEGSDD